MADDEDDPICTQCGKPRSAHKTDPRTLEPTKCPVAPGDQGQTVTNSEHMRERANMKRAQASDDIEGPLCAHPYGDPHEAKYKMLVDGRWVPVCQRHVDPSKECTEIYPDDP